MLFEEPKATSVHNIKIHHLLKNAVGYNQNVWKRLVVGHNFLKISLYHRCDVPVVPHLML